jgi:hypothetical protein
MTAEWSALVPNAHMQWSAVAEYRIYIAENCPQINRTLIDINSISRILLEKLTVAQLGKRIFTLMEPMGSLSS